MTAQKQSSGSDLLRSRRGQLLKLRDELLAAIKHQHGEAQELQLEANGTAREFEDDAQALMLLEVGEDLASRDMERLAQVDRALAKLGVY